MHPVARLYERENDFPLYRGGPKKTYMIAAIPRTGSTHLSIKLWNTGAMGAPMEYTNLSNRDRMIQRLGRGDSLTYWKRLKTVRTSPNGVFGFKAFVSDYRNIAANHEALLPMIESDKVIYLVRKDRVAQAVSYAKAVQTAAWFSGVEYKKEPEYDLKAMLNAENWINQQESAWEEIFQMTGTSPLRIYYEDFLADTEKSIMEIAKFLEIHPAEFHPLGLQDIEKQSDQISQEWARKFTEYKNTVGQSGDIAA
ncbi:LPS sulfotransferase NodH [Nitrospirillum pindoramense]|uniref:LPS sulfotransferase NodH n=2 Tax=Nitrospirillum amazonense TaxID=28077 RepID=A0A560GV04_9PROT|nr:LPS sulfotransferase NodH [Nitrospirillum amazonense]